MDTLGQKPSGAKASMEQQGTLKNVVEGMTAAASTLGALHDDIGGTFGGEVAKMRGVGVFTNFYGALKETREYYARHGATAAIGQQQASSQAAVARAKRVETKFSGEETWGKYLDLSARHREFCNLPNAPVDLDYVTYLRHLGSKPFSTHVAESKKTHGGYVRYAAAMDAYLTDFWARTQPLVPLEPLLAEPLRAFEKSYAEKNQTNGEALDLRTRHGIGPATVLVVALGVNDVTSQMSPQRYVANLRLLCERLMAQAGVEHIVFSGLPPMHLLPVAPQPLRWYLGRYARKLDRALRDWIDAEAALRYCSLQWALPHEMAIDRFHPGHGQYAQWARMSAEIIESEFLRHQPVTESV